MSQEEIIWIISVITAVAVLIFISSKISAYITNQNKKYANTFNLIHRVLRVSLVLIGLVLISYVFFEESVYKDITKNLSRVIWVSLVALSSIVSAAITRSYLQRKISEDNEDQLQSTLRFANFLITTTIYLFGAGLAILAFPALKEYAQTLLTGAGIFAIGVGFAAQEAMGNIASGMLIIIFRPFKIGDILKIRDDMVGRVEDITIRHTIIKNFQNKRIVVPNAIINKEKLINYDLGERKTCAWIEIGISYDSSIKEAKKIILEECMKHENLIDNRSNKEVSEGAPKVIIRVIGLGDSSVNLRAWAWSWDYTSAFTMKCDLMETIKERFDEEGIEIPFPHRTLVYKDKPENYDAI